MMGEAKTVGHDERKATSMSSSSQVAPTKVSQEVDRHINM